MPRLPRDRSHLRPAEWAAPKGRAVATTSRHRVKGAVTIMANGKAKSVAVGALALVLIAGGAVAVGYYVLYGDEPSAVATPKPQPSAAQNRAMASRWASSPRPLRPCRAVETRM